MARIAYRPTQQMTDQARKLTLERGNLAHLMGSPYEVGQHMGAAASAGLVQDEINALLSDSPSTASDFSHAQRAVVRLTTELLTTRHAAAATVGEVYEALGAEATIEVLMVVNRWAGLALMLNALDVDLDETARLAVPPTAVVSASG
jgi:alkylhydroperoxidase family enzyme